MSNAASTNNPQFHISPDTALIDERASIRLSGLPPDQTVTIRAQMGNDWSSHAVFQTDASGEIALAAQKPLSGTYDVADSMGLVWSMQFADPESFQLWELWGKSLDPTIIHLTAEIDNELVARAQLKRLQVLDGVKRTVVRDEGLRATFFEPADPGPHPAIILVSGSGGGLNENRAALYASRGIAALALAYFSYDDLPKGLVEIPLEYFETAIQWLQNHDNVDGDRIAMSGSSRGGELSLLAGATFPQIKAVVAYVPSGYAWGGLGEGAETPKAAWTYKGQPVSYVSSDRSPETEKLYAELSEKGEPIPLTPNFHASFKAADNLESALISVEKINGAILLLSGDDDQMWPSSYFSKLIMQRLAEHNFPHPYKHIGYPGAGHLVLTPHIPTTITYSRHPVVPSAFAYGGNAPGGAFANEDSWKQTLEFLRENL